MGIYISNVSTRCTPSGASGHTIRCCNPPTCYFMTGYHRFRDIMYRAALRVHWLYSIFVF